MIKFENSENGRFYYLKISIDLLGDHVLTVIRGGKLSRAIVIKHSGFKCLTELNKALKGIVKTRLKRGYQQLSSDFIQYQNSLF